MNKNNQFTIMEFSRLTGIKRENLRFYDRIGLLSPETRGENNYRYYSSHQLSMAYLIGGLRNLGVGIEEIKQYAAQRTPENTLALHARQEARIQEDIRRLQERSLIMGMHADILREALEQKEDALFLTEKKSEAIFLCPLFSNDMDENELGVLSYHYAEENGVNLEYPQGTAYDWKDLEEAEEAEGAYAGRYYFKVNSGGNACKPAGHYAVACGRCAGWEDGDIIRRLFDFITAQKLRICGDLYEEYPMGDIEIEGRYSVRLEVPVAAV